MRILLVLDRARLRPWTRDLARDLVAQGFELRLGTRHGDEPSRLVRLLFELDHLLNGAPRSGGGGPLAPDDVAPAEDAAFRPDAILDLTARPSAVAGVPVFAAAYDGRPGEDALLGALTTRGGVGVDVFDPATGEIVEHLRPSLERARGPTDAMAMVGARLGAVLVARLLARREGRDRPRASPPIGATRIAPAAPSLAAFGRSLATDLARHLYRLVTRSPHWRVGWRHLDGPGLAETGDFETPLFRPVPDDGLRCFADPFPLEWQGRTQVLVEDLDHRTGKGMISAIPFDAAGPSGPPVPVLEEPWHLSYPFPIVEDGVLYVVPESTARRDVGLYRCIAFPDRWERVATLLTDICASDVSIIRHGGRLWMFSTVEDGRGGWSDMLAIHSAPSLFGPWTPHRDVPLLVDVAMARPAGRPFVDGGRLFRPVQDGSSVYGGAVALVEVTRLDDERYEQVVHRRLCPGRAWPGRRLHTLNRLGRLEVVDGVVPRPKWDPLDRLTAPLWQPRGRR
jgi:hypothetical protein